MNDEAGFLKAIAEQPAERSTRLVYADWLDEHGRPREAEFLRLQIQVAELSARLAELGDAIGAQWLAAVGGLKVVPQWFNLRDGRAIFLSELRQRNFNEGVWEGHPTSEMNRAGVERLVAEERQRGGAEPYLIQPTEWIAPPIEDDPWNEPRGRLPDIVCVARFESKPVADPYSDTSTLTIIWFQHDWALPIDPVVREQIRAIEWEKHAHDR